LRVGHVPEWLIGEPTWSHVHVGVRRLRSDVGGSEWLTR
jgi:hypothetical protein